MASPDVIEIEGISQQKQAASLPRINPGRRNALTQAVHLQRIVYETAELIGDDCKQLGKDREQRAKSATALGNLAKSWETIVDRIRILRGRPMPGSLRPEPKPKKPRRTRVSNDPVDPSMLKESPLAKPEEPKATSEGNNGTPG